MKKIYPISHAFMKKLGLSIFLILMTSSYIVGQKRQNFYGFTKTQRPEKIIAIKHRAINSDFWQRENLNLEVWPTAHISVSSHVSKLSIQETFDISTATLEGLGYGGALRFYPLGNMHAQNFQPWMRNLLRKKGGRLRPCGLMDLLGNISRKESLRGAYIGSYFDKGNYDLTNIAQVVDRTYTYEHEITRVVYGVELGIQAVFWHILLDVGYRIGVNEYIIQGDEGELIKDFFPTNRLSYYPYVNVGIFL